MARAIKIGTDCSGMETPLMALTNLGVDFKHVFACDIDKHVKETIMSNFPPKFWYSDLTARDNASAPSTDLYVAGFPCQPFSAAGKQQGFGDEKGRGTIFWKVREYINAQRPKVFILENVSRLKTLHGGQYYRDIRGSLEAVGRGSYNIYDRILNTMEHGVPQNRKRIYFVGILKSMDRGTFSFPEPLPRVSIENFLDPKPKGARVSATMLPPKSASTARRNVKIAIRRLLRAGKRPFVQPYIADIDSTTPRMKYMLDQAPCITCNRCGGRGHWIMNRGRRLNIVETMRLQGMHTPKDGFNIVVKTSETAKQVGNAMSVNVLERLLVRILSAARLVPRALPDRWAHAARLDRMPRPVRLQAPAKTKSKEPQAAAPKRRAGGLTARTAKRARGRLG